MISFKQFFETVDSTNLSMVRRSPRRNLMKMSGSMIAKDHKLSGQRKAAPVEAIAKGMSGEVFLSPIKAAEIAKQYNITLPDEGEERSINSNSKQKITRRGGKYFLNK